MKVFEEFEISSYVHATIIMLTSFGWFYFSFTLLFELNYFDYVKSVIHLFDDTEKISLISKTVKIIGAAALTFLLLITFIAVPFIAIACINYVWDKLGLIKILD
jgi:hypothetical protein